MMTKSPYHHDSLDKSITLDFDLSQRDPSFASFRQPYTISYSLQLPLKPTGDTPVLVLCHPFNNSRLYWSPQLHDPLFASYPIITIDAVGFSHSRTGGRDWSFDLAAESVLAILDELAQARIEGYRSDIKAVVIGDSMGGGPTGLRVLLRDQERVQSGMEARVLGTVACGTAAEVESSDFVKQYTESAAAFARDCLDSSIGPAVAIRNLATGMAQDGYTDEFDHLRSFSSNLIEQSLLLALSNDQGVLDPVFAGDTMVLNYKCLNHRLGVVEELSVRPSKIGSRQVLVVHGTEDKAYPLERGYHTNTVAAVGEANSELHVVEGGPHFVTISHWQEVDRVIVDWIARKCK